MAASRMVRWAATVAVGAVAAGGLPAVASASVPAVGSAADVFGPVSGVPHAMGLPITQPAVASRAAVANVQTSAAALPVSVDLTALAAPPGDQGDVGSCAAWATDYTALGYWENEEGISGGVLAPMYTYSQLVNGQNVGTTIDSHLVIAEQQGVDNQTNYTQGNYDYTDLPTAAEKTNASHWKLTNYQDLTVVPSSSSTVTQQSIETALANGTPVVIGIPVYMNFETLTSANHGLYSGPSGEELGGHAIAALGYNSTGLRIENSWGTDWGDSGYATLSWSFVNGYVFQATAVGPLSPAGPVATTPPAITGTAQQGQTLTASAGTWIPAATSYTYQWQRSTNSGSTWSAISGATSASYLLASADVGAMLRVVVTTGNSSGRGTAVSATVGPIPSGAPVSTTAPAITGTVRQGETLTASNGVWTPAATSYGYQWQRSTNSGSTWSAISGATSATYVPGSADLTASLRVVVTASNSKGQGTATSAAVGPVVSGAPVSTAVPAITGTARQGQTLTASNGTWAPSSASYGYQWQRSTNSGGTWSAISGATSASYVLGSGDVSATVRVVVTGINAYGQASANSAGVGPVLSGVPAVTAAPAITGTARQGQTLTASTGTWNPAASSYAYQWQRSTNSGGTWSAISGAASASYVLASGDVAATVRVLVTATNSYGPASAPATAVGPVASGAPASTAGPAITGSAVRGVTLTVSTGTWSPAAAAYAYQWQRSTNSGSSWSNITGATSSSYALAKVDEAATIRVIVTATNSYGQGSAASTAAGPVKASPPANTILPSIGGSAAVGGTLTGNSGAWSTTGLAFTYAWQRGTAAKGYQTIAGATSSTYKPQAADAGQNLRLIVTATNDDGSVSAISVATATVVQTSK